jgi:hypothetical protein
MKKNFLKLLALFLIIILNSKVLVMAEENLNIDSNVLNDSKKTYSSYTDVYNLNIFSDEYNDALRKSKLEKEHSDEELMTIIFTESSNIDKSNYSIDEDIKELNLFTDIKTQDRLKSNTQKQFDFTILIVIFFVIICYLSYVVANKYYFRKRKDTYNENYNNYKISEK